MKAPNNWKLEELYEITHRSPRAYINDKWVPSRPMGLFSIVSRIKLAWSVFTGKADALVWPEGQ